MYVVMAMCRIMTVRPLITPQGHVQSMWHQLFISGATTRLANGLSKELSKTHESQQCTYQQMQEMINAIPSTTVVT